MSKHIYYKVTLTLTSPMSIGSGSAAKTDSDIVRNGIGMPIIPATTLAGIYRSVVTGDMQNKLFGFIDEDKHQQSIIIVYDGTLIKETPVCVRDCVALNDCKVAKECAKFDFEAIETGARFVTYIEVDKNHWDETIEATIQDMLSRLNNGHLSLGSKTTRGYGKVQVEALKSSFEFPKDKSKWLFFSPFDADCWNNAKLVELSSSEQDIVIMLKLKLLGGISIRRYVTEASTKGNSSPDFQQMTTSDQTPVIPGTSWAGAFRYQYGELGGDISSPQSIFGYVNSSKAKKKEIEKEEAKKSQVTFSESRLYGGSWKIVTRNSIDRFSGGTKNGALYTEKTYYGGTCELEIRLKPDIAQEEQRLINACILDLHNGFLSIGGLTPVGRGLFQIEDMTVNGISKKACLVGKEQEKGGWVYAL